MSDQYTKVTKTGYGTRIGRSFKGIFIGILLFIASFVVLFWNEGRVDMSNVAEEATQISATEQADVALEGKLISTTGKLTTNETLGDGLYLKPGEYISLNRKVEMYSWVEETSSETTTNLGGSQTTETTYNYVKEWVENPADSSNFEHPEDHDNPAKFLESKNFVVSSAQIGVYQIKPNEISLPSSANVTLKDNIINIEDSNASVEGNYIYKRSTSSTNGTAIGDIRISYTAVRSGMDVTVFGKLNGSAIDPFVDKNGNQLYRSFTGTPEQAVEQMHKEYKMMLWIVRLIGFIMMWAGLGMVLAPLSVLLDVLPALGSVSRGLVGFITFLVAFVLSLVTILVSMILHSWIALIVVVAMVGAIVFFVLKKKLGKKK